MDESIDPELSAGVTSRAGGKHQAEGTGAAGKHEASGPRPARKGFSRRKMLISGGALAAGFAGLDALRSLAVTPARVASPAAAFTMYETNPFPRPVPSSGGRNPISTSGGNSVSGSSD